MADGILLMTREGTTQKRQLKRGLEALHQSKLLGVVLNSSTNADHSNYYRRYGAYHAPLKVNAEGPRSLDLALDHKTPWTLSSSVRPLNPTNPNQESRL